MKVDVTWESRHKQVNLASPKTSFYCEPLRIEPQQILKGLVSHALDKGTDLQQLSADHGDSSLATTSAYLQANPDKGADEVMVAFVELVKDMNYRPLSHR